MKQVISLLVWTIVRVVRVVLELIAEVLDISSDVAILDPNTFVTSCLPLDLAFLCRAVLRDSVA